MPSQPHPKFAARSQRSSVARPNSEMNHGIDVREEELGVATAQRLFKLRCECGRSWFELELPTLVKCPACAKLSLVSA